MYKANFLLVIFCLLPFLAAAQQERLRDENQIGWFVYNGDHALSRKWELHTEYQWRRVYWISEWQQWLARLGANYSVNDKITGGFGYTTLVTHPYGDYPIADKGVPYPEHRIYEDIQIADTVGVVTLGHRFRLEQRWISDIAPDGSRRIASWEYQNRIRYQIEATLPLQGRTVNNREFFVSFFDELFIGFGRNVDLNVYNQNRIYGGIGYQFRDNLSAELGYLNQITQHADPDPVSGNRVFEYNNGFRLSLNYNLDFRRY
ncbi:DUF2490 domain-containing protein [Fibrisoma montanum]|uniref:DUF2490 domain-containing protein n=2 Tax=Fibrisoma montanum TaxID=2305895 RepID=A0A418M8M0_9BACT|nr:DUF2490 domain-containing protein [Fibrisoma montanum]